MPTRILTYVPMPNHFHLVLWPRRGQGETLSEFMRWLAGDAYPAWAPSPPPRGPHHPSRNTPVTMDDEC